MFENKVFFVKSGTLSDTVVEQLNEFGKEGWEVSGILKNSSDQVIFFLKRKIEVSKKRKVEH